MIHFISDCCLILWGTDQQGKKTNTEVINHEVGNIRSIVKWLDKANDSNLATILDWFSTNVNPILFPRKIHPFKIGYGDTLLEQPSNSEKYEMMKRAEQTGLTSGYYEGWQLIQIFEWKDNLWKEIIAEMNTAYAINDQLAAYLADICGYVRRIAEHRKLYTEDENGKRVYPVTEQDAGNIMKSLTETFIRIERMLDNGWRIGLTNYNIDPGALAEQRVVIEMDNKELYGNVISLVDGIRNLINAKDEGESLRLAVKELAIGLPEIRAWLTNMTKFGAPEQETIKRLMQRVYEYRENQKLKWDDVWNYLIDYYYHNNLNGHEQEEKSKLDEYESGGGLDTLKRQYNRWKKAKNGT